MMTRHVLGIAMLACVSAAPVPKRDVPIAGDYVEARTASVFAGACHYNGERVTTGNQAVAAWHFTAGTYHGVDLAGATAVAAVSSPSNLADVDPGRSCELVIDAKVAEQVEAVVDLLRTREVDRIGTVTSIRRATVRFSDVDHAYAVSADGFVSMTVRPMPNNECCSQPHLVWYEPMTQLEHRKVGYTTVAGYSAGTNGDAWQRADENSAFYGPFTF